MGRFIVLLAVRTFLDMNPENCKITIDNTELSIGDTEIFLRKMSDPRDYNLSGLDYGWMIEVKLTESNIEKAITKAQEISEVFLSIICLETAHPVYGSKVILSYEITDDVERRVFRQYLNVTPVIKNAEVELPKFTDHAHRIFDYNNITLMEELTSKQTKTLQKNRNRTYRAIRWFRKGIISSDPLDQFLSFWHGLESLNVVLAEYYGEDNNTKLKEIGRKCENCGKGCKTFVPAGIEALYDDLKIDETLKKKISRTRIGLVHGTLSIEELNANALDLLPTIAIIIHMGLSKILEITFDSKKNLERIHPIKVGELIGIEGFLKVTDPSKIKNDYYPHVTVNKTNGKNNLIFNISGYELENMEHLAFGKNIEVNVKEKLI